MELIAINLLFNYLTQGEECYVGNSWAEDEKLKQDGYDPKNTERNTVINIMINTRRNIL